MGNYKCHVVAMDDDKFVHDFGTVIVDADDEDEAVTKALDELWEPRLTCSGCRSEVTVREQCERCKEYISYDGDWYDGMCPECADTTEDFDL